MTKNNRIKRICVYCGSSPGTNPAFVTAAQTLGTLMAKNGVGLVYGGGGAGLMGAVGKAVNEHGGHVTGIIPEFLMSRERALRDINDLVVTKDMHERKRLMFERADAFVALPGGIGTLEELVEQLTWVQLGRHKKPVVIANIEGFWDPLCALLDHMRALKFIHAEILVDPIVVDRIEYVLPVIEEALSKLSETDKAMKTAEVERL
ncbi:MAG TPA: TIGR00730 family Rossman fold protein [Pseudolabrys sp.]|nr:TIGR00730 family Rossman fold protein [Pseudolabrys sp.]